MYHFRLQRKMFKGLFSTLIVLIPLATASSVFASNLTDPDQTKGSNDSSAKTGLKRFANSYGRMTIYRASRKKGPVFLIDYLSPSGKSAELAYSPSEGYWEFSAFDQAITLHRPDKSGPIHVSFSTKENGRQWSFESKDGLLSPDRYARGFNEIGSQLSPQFLILYTEFLNFVEQESTNNKNFRLVGQGMASFATTPPLQSKSCESTLAWTGVSITASAMLTTATCIASSGITCGAAVAAWVAGSTLANDNAMQECEVEEEGDGESGGGSGGGGGGGW